MRLDLTTRYSLVHDWLPIWTARLFILFLIIFPKGGLDLGTMPLTWGYMLIGMAAVGLMPVFFYRVFSNQIETRVYGFAVCIGIFFFWVFASICMNGSTTTLGFLVSLFISTLVLPLFFILLLPRPTSPIFYRAFIKDLKNALFVVALLGVVLFLYKLITGDFIGIPYLTFTGSDVSALDEKDNSRNSDVSKLISTYNNGNIYGACMLMSLPFYDEAEKSLWKRLFFKMAICLTLSRTAWAGLMFYQIFDFMVFHKISFKKLIVFILGMVLSVFAILVVAEYMQWDFSTIFDRELGGRTLYQGEVTMLPQDPFSGINEITYVSMLYDFGIIGLVLFLVFYFAPSVYLGLYTEKLGRWRKRALFGIIVYWMVSLSDGAFLLIPVTAFYWFFNWMLFNPKFLLIEDVAN